GGGVAPAAPAVSGRPARVGLVLGGGGTVGGAFHAGVLAALASAGWDARSAEVIVGTSAGSITGALLRAGLPPSDLEARALDRPLSAEGAGVMGRVGLVSPPSLSGGRRRVGAAPMTAPSALMAAALRPWRARPGALAAALLPSGTVPTDVIRDSVGPLFGSRWPSQ